MHEFHYRQNELFCEDVPVKTLAEKIGTPFYLYSAKTLLNHYRAYDSAFASIPHLITFAMKANSNLAILRLFAKEGGGADIVFQDAVYANPRIDITEKVIKALDGGKAPAR